MDIETTLAKSLSIAEEKASYDAACKRLLSEKVILAWIMKSCLEEYREYSVDEIAENYIQEMPQVAEVRVAPDETNAPSLAQSIGTEDTTMTEGTVTYDIRFKAIVPASGEWIRLIINVEAQNDFYPGYPLVKRGIYYCSRMISSQYGVEFSESHYEDIKKVYSIWICMNPPKNRKNSITRYYITEENLVGNVTEPKKNYDLLTTVMLCLGDETSGNYDGVLKLLDVLLSTETNSTEKKQILEEDFQIKMTQSFETEVSIMCNLSKGVEEKGIKKGLQQGLAQGREQGLVQGREQGLQQGREQGMKKGIKKGIKEATLFSVQNLMDSMDWTVEQAMTALKIKKSEWEEYAEALKKNV